MTKDKKLPNGLHIYDSRLVGRFIKDGVLSQDEYNKHLEQLPDSADNVDWIDVDGMVEEVEQNSY